MRQTAISSRFRLWIFLLLVLLVGISTVSYLSARTNPEIFFWGVLAGFSFYAVPLIIPLAALTYAELHSRPVSYKLMGWLGGTVVPLIIMAQSSRFAALTMLLFSYVVVLPYVFVTRELEEISNKELVTGTAIAILLTIISDLLYVKVTAGIY